MDASCESSPGPVSCCVEHLLLAGCLTQVIPFILLTHSLSLQKKKEIQRGLLACPGTESWPAELIHIRICQMLTGKVLLCYFLRSFPFRQAEREISTAFPSHQTLSRELFTLVLTTASEGRWLLFPFNRGGDWGTCGLLAWLRSRWEYVAELRYSCGSSWLQGVNLHWLAFISDDHAPGIYWAFERTQSLEPDLPWGAVWPLANNLISEPQCLHLSRGDINDISLKHCYED